MYESLTDGGGAAGARLGPGRGQQNMMNCSLVLASDRTSRHRADRGGTEEHLLSGAANDQSVITITKKAPTRAFFWLKAPTSTFTFKTLLRHYAKRVLTTR